MGPCCCRSTACPGTDRFFSRWSRWYARQYRAEGLERIQRKLLRGVKALQKPAGNVLDDSLQGPLRMPGVTILPAPR